MREKSAPVLKEEFLRDLQFFRRFSDHTISAYKRDLSLYEEFLSSSGKRLAGDLSANPAGQTSALKTPSESRSAEKPPAGGAGAKGEGSDLYDFLTKKGLSKRSIARLMSAVRSYFHWMESRGEQKNISQEQRALPAARMADFTLPRFHPALPKPLSFKNFQTLLDAVSDGEKNPALKERNRLILLLLFGLGCRVSELTALNLRDFNETDSRIRIQGKGRRERHLPVSASLNAAIVHYVKEARPLIAAPSVPSLICNNRGRRPSRQDIWRRLKAWSCKAGLKEAISPHSFRHGFAGSLLEGGADLISIQKLLGHKNLQTTQIYTQVSSRRLKETVQKHHPLSDPA